MRGTSLAGECSVLHIQRPTRVASSAPDCSLIQPSSLPLTPRATRILEKITTAIDTMTTPTISHIHVSTDATSPFNKTSDQSRCSAVLDRTAQQAAVSSGPAVVRALSSPNH